MRRTPPDTANRLKTNCTRPKDVPVSGSALARVGTGVGSTTAGGGASVEVVVVVVSSMTGAGAGVVEGGVDRRMMLPDSVHA
jgi:hypothetical protein